MAAKACKKFQWPEENIEKVVGDSVTSQFRIENCGGEDGNFYYRLLKDGVDCDSDWNEPLKVGEWSYTVSCRFDMPNRNVKLKFLGGHSEGGIWKQDYEDEITISPKAVAKPCLVSTNKTEYKIGDTVTITYKDAPSGTSLIIHHSSGPLGKSWHVSGSGTKTYTIKASDPKGSWEVELHDTDCRKVIYITIKEAAPEYCTQSIRVVTSDGAAVKPQIEWADGGTSYGEKTPWDASHSYKKGERYTVRVSAYGYEAASRTFTTCRSQFTLTLTKEEVPCSDWTTKSTCEAHGCFWYNNACHRFRPTVCSDYTDALTCAANNCYWWSDGTCHDTEEVAPPECTYDTDCAPGYKCIANKCVKEELPSVAKFGLSEVVENHLPEWITGYACASCDVQYEYKCPEGYKRTQCTPHRHGTHGCCPDCMVVFVKCESEAPPDVVDTYQECGDYPTESSTKHKLTTWWACATRYAFNTRRICEKYDDDYTAYFRAVRDDVTASEGFLPYCPYYGCKHKEWAPNGHGVELYFKSAALGKWNIGTFSYLCSDLPAIEKKDTVICDFDVYDAAGNKVTDLVAGAQYTIKAWLCEKHLVSCAVPPLKGCLVNSYAAEGGELKLFLSGQAAEIAKGTTNVDGYTAFFWTPSADIAGDNSIRLEFKGSTKYNASETGWKTVTVSVPYTISITVKDQDGKPLVGAYVDIDKYTEGVWREVKCSEAGVVVTKGTCSTDTFVNDKDNIKTDSTGKVSFTLPFLPGGIPNKYGFRAGKVGYLNKEWHEDWTDRQETTPQPAPQGGHYDFEFVLTDKTQLDAFIITTQGTKKGDSVLVYEPLPLTKCFIRKPLGYAAKKILLAPNLTVQFDKSDGLVVGKEYTITTSIPILGVDFATGPSWCGVFSGKKAITISRYGAAGILCDFFGIDPGSDECRRFLAEFADPIYIANVITGIQKGEDIYGAPYNPSKFEMALFPVVLICSAFPMIPGAKISKFLGRAVKIGKKTSKVSKYLEDDYAKIYKATMSGDDARLTKWTKAIEAEDVVEARRITNDIIANPALSDAASVRRVKIGLDELDTTIKTKVKAGSNVNDLKTRMVKIADEYVDRDTYIKSMDDAYADYISIMQKGTRAKVTDMFTKAGEKICTLTPWKCKYNVLNATDKLKVGKEELDLLDITKILKENVKETDALYSNCFRGLADLDEKDIHGLNYLINNGMDDRVVMELRTHAIKVGDKKSFDWMLHHNEWALNKWGKKWPGMSRGSRFGREFWRSTWAGIKNHTPWSKKADDIADVLTDTELEKLLDAGTLNKIAKNLDAEGRYIDAGELVRYVVRKDPEFFKKGYSNALMKTFDHFDDETNIAKHIKPLTAAEAANRRTWFKGIRTEFQNTLGKERGDEVFKKLGLDAIEETSDLNKAFWKSGKANYDNAFNQALSIKGTTQEQASAYAKLNIQTKTDFAHSVSTGAIKDLKGLRKWYHNLYEWMGRHKLLMAVVIILGPWGTFDNGQFMVYIGRAGGVIPDMWKVQWDDARRDLESAYYSLRDNPCVKTFQTQYLHAMGRMDTLITGAKPIPTDKIEKAKHLFTVFYGFHIGDPNELLLDLCKVNFAAWDERYFTLVQKCIDPIEPPWDWPVMPVLGEVLHDVKVVKVIDGDTIDIYSDEIEWPHGESIRVRILGANTPEGATKNYLVRRMATIKGEEERWNVDKTLYDKVNKWANGLLWHEYVTLKTDSSRQWDNYHRFLAVVNKNSLDVGKKELELGYAPVYFYDANKQVNTSAYLAAEKIAKDANLGVWRFYGDTGTIRCISSPETAVDVYVDDELEPRGKTVSNVFLMERVSIGTHTITFKKLVSGVLHSCTTSVTVRKDRTVEATCEMTVAGKASFWIDSDPQGAKIYIDGTYKNDLTPANKVFLIDAGTHTFKLIKSGCTTWEKAYTLSEGEEWFYDKKSKTVPLVCEEPEEPEEPEKGKMHCKTLKPNAASLSNAKIYVTGGKYDNTYLGDTEKTLTIETGTYTVRYTHPDYTDDCIKTNVVVSTVGIGDATCQFTGEVVPPEEEEAVWHITEAKDAITGAAITRAEVYVDDVYIHGWAPEDITFCVGCKCDTYVNCGFGTHTVKVVKGDKEWTKTRDVKAGDVFTDTPLLEEAKITVKILSVPEGATVRIDGKLISLYRLTGALKRVKTLGYE